MSTANSILDFAAIETACDDFAALGNVTGILMLVGQHPLASPYIQARAQGVTWRHFGNIPDAVYQEKRAENLALSLRTLVNASDIDQAAALTDYLAALLWSSSDGTGDGNHDACLDATFTVADIPGEERAKAAADLAAFLTRAAAAGLPVTQDRVGHDFCLDRNGHGAGAADGHYPADIGDKLAALARESGEVWPYAGDDGRVYVE